MTDLLVVGSGAAGLATTLAAVERGAHYRTDAPETDPRWRGHILWRRDTAPGFEEIAR